MTDIITVVIGKYRLSYKVKRRDNNSESLSYNIHPYEWYRYGFQ